MTTGTQGQTKLISTGIDGLDHILGGGLTAHRVYLVEGSPGSGKTTLALNFLLEGMKSGEPGLYVTLSETSEELKEVARSHGWNLDSLSLFELIPKEETLEQDSHYTMFHPSEVELSETTHAILQEVERSNPRRIVFDSLSEMRLLAQNPLRFRRQLLALKQFFIGRRCTALMLDDRTEGHANSDIHSIAHGVIQLEQAAPVYGAERRRLRVVKMRGVSFSGGHHDFAIRTGGLRVFPRLVAAQHLRPFADETAPSGLQALDQLLGGGLDRGTSTLIMGPAGSGKSTLAIQYAYAAAARGERVRISVFDETIDTLRKRSRGMGVDLDPYIKDGTITLQHIDPAELSPGEFAHDIRKAVEEDQVRVVVIDSLNGYLNAMPEERFLIAQLHEMLTFLNQQGVTTLMVMAQNGILGQNMTAPVDASYLADNVVLIRFFELQGEVRQALSIMKKRSGAHERTIREMRMGGQGITIGQPLKEFRGVLSGIPSIERIVNGA